MSLLEDLNWRHAVKAYDPTKKVSEENINNIISLLKREITQQELLNYYNACITIIELPDGINGFVFSYENIYNIFINKDLSYYKRKKTILHELAHIELSQLKQLNKDMFAFYIEKYEDEADKYLNFIIETIKEEKDYGYDFWYT